MNPSPDAEHWFDQGLNDYDQQQYDLALNCFQEAIKINQQFIPAWIYQGMTLEQMGKYDDAIASYNQAIDINPNITDLWYNKATTLSYLKRYPEALVCFDQVLEIDPNHAFCKTARSLTLAVLSNPRKLDQPIIETEEREPLTAEAEASMQLQRSRESYTSLSQINEIDEY